MIISGILTLLSNPIVIVIVVALILIIIIKVKANIKIKRVENKSNEALAKATEIRDESYVKLNDENRNLKNEIDELKAEKMKLLAHINGLNNAQKDKKELYILNLALDKIKNNPKTSVIFMSFWPTFYDEAKQEYEDSSIGKKIFNFISPKNFRNSNNNIEVKEVKVIEDKK